MLPGFENRWRALSFCRRWTAFKNSGVAIIEFALTAPILVILLLNVVDFSFFDLGADANRLLRPNRGMGSV